MHLERQQSPDPHQMEQMPCGIPRGISVYPSRVDWWFMIVVVVALAICADAAFRLATSGSTGDLLILGVLIAVLGIIGMLLIPTRYLIGDGLLVVQSGVWKVRIPLASIRRVSPTRSLLASPALSLDRLAVLYRTGTIYISPARQDAFLRELGEVAGLERSGRVLARSELHPN